MPSDRITRALLSKGIFEAQITVLNEGRAWQLLYEIEGRDNAKRRPKSTLPEICFTGFTDPEKEALWALARERGYTPKNTVTAKLKLLVTGPNAGPSKLEQAQARGCPIITEAEFRSMAPAAQ